MNVCKIALPPNLNVTRLRELASSLEQAAADDSVRVVVLEGSADVFCGGLDLDELGRLGEAAADSPWRAAAEDFCRCLRALRFSSKPTVALVEAPALGGGAGLAAACDVVIASEEATFGLPEVLFGLAPAMILPVILDRMTPQRARLWAITGVTRSAQEALAAGLVDSVVSAAKVQSEGKRWIKMLCRANPQGVATIKRLCREVPQLDPAEAIDVGRAATVAALDEPELRGKIAQFRDFGMLPWE